MKTKNNNYNNLFDEVDVLDAKFEYKKTKVKYTAKFYDKHLRDWEGFYFDECNIELFKDIATSDIGNEKEFDSIQEIIDLIPYAKKYHKDTTHVLIERFVSFVDEDDEIILYMAAGKRDLEI
jgi:hypothetical protein